MTQDPPAAPARLLLWRRDDPARDPRHTLAVLAFYATGARLVNGGDPTLAALVSELAKEPHLPLAEHRPLPGGGRAVGLRRATPGEADYPRAFAEALTRRGAYFAAEA